jgi:hypothetical protein
VSRWLRIVVFLVLSACGVAQQQDQWTSGTLIKVERQGRAYDYSVFDGRCGFVGHSTKKLDTNVGEEVRFSIEGRVLLIVDRTGKTHRTQFRLQWLSPPTPPRVAKQDK